MIRGMGRSVRRAVVAVVVLAAVAGCAGRDMGADKGGDKGAAERRGVGQVSATELGFVRHAGAVEWPGVSDWVPQGRGLRWLLPVGECALGVGNYQNGFRSVGANWAGDAACDRLWLEPAPDGKEAGGDGPPAKGGGWAGGGVGGDAFLVEGDGSVLAATSSGLYRYRGGTAERLARIDLSTAGFEGQGTRSLVTGMVRAGGRIIVGADLGARPAVLVSDDGGSTLRRLELPAADGGQLPAVLASDADTVVAIGNGASRRAVWRSVDAGRTWQVASIDGLPAHLMVTRLVRAGQQWLAFGGVDHEDGAQDDTMVLASADGLTWAKGPVEGLGAGRVSDVTVDRDGTVVMTGIIDDALPHVEGQRTEFCGVVWLGDGVGAWRRGELGCGDAPPQAVATLRDGRVLIAGNRDLWLRADGKS